MDKLWLLHDAFNSNITLATSQYKIEKHNIHSETFNFIFHKLDFNSSSPLEPEPEQERSHISNYGTGTKIGLAPQPWILIFCHLIIWNNLANFSFLVSPHRETTPETAVSINYSVSWSVSQGSVNLSNM